MDADEEGEQVHVELFNHRMSYDEEWTRPLTEAVQWLQDCLAHVPPEHREAAYFTFEYERGYYDESASSSLKVGYWRPITDEEIAAREAEEKANAEAYRLQQEARERATLEALKAKYE